MTYERAGSEWQLFENKAVKPKEFMERYFGIDFD